MLESIDLVFSIYPWWNINLVICIHVRYINQAFSIHESRRHRNRVFSIPSTSDIRFHGTIDSIYIYTYPGIVNHQGADNQLVL